MLSKALLLKAAEAFVVAFLAVEPVANLIGVVTGSQPVDLSTLRAAAVAGVAAAVAYLYHAVLGGLASRKAAA